MYEELVYFEGAHFAHICAYLEYRRLRRIKAVVTSALSHR